MILETISTHQPLIRRDVLNRIDTVCDEMARAVLLPEDVTFRDELMKCKEEFDELNNAKNGSKVSSDYLTELVCKYTELIDIFVRAQIHYCYTVASARAYMQSRQLLDECTITYTELLLNKGFGLQQYEDSLTILQTIRDAEVEVGLGLVADTEPLYEALGLLQKVSKD